MKSKKKFYQQHINIIRKRYNSRNTKKIVTDLQPVHLASMSILRERSPEIEAGSV